ncbi:MAG: riboflavin kinase [Candidatus Hydrogenedentota bacterium]
MIRERILQGDLETVELLLGRKYSVAGKVERGRGIGKTIGFPTANVRPYHTAIPAQGVYIAESVIDGDAYPSAVNIGIAPTIRNEDITIEAHLLDFDRDINGSEIEVLFHKRVRPEKKFPGKEALIEQIGRDVEAVRAYFG